MAVNFPEVGKNHPSFVCSTSQRVCAAKTLLCGKRHLSRDGDNTPSQVSFCLVRPPRVHFVSGPYNKTLLTLRASHQAGNSRLEKLFGQDG